MSGITITWATRVINVAKSYLTPTANPDIFNLDTDIFRLDLKNLEDDEIGMAYPDTHQHNTEVPLGGTIYARVIEIINGYTITFEDGQYAVNLIGSNNNVGDVVNVNQVSIRTNNAAGLIVDPDSTSDIGNVDDIAIAVWNALTSSGNTDGSFGLLLTNLMEKANISQHSLNVHTEMLKNKPNNC